MNCLSIMTFPFKASKMSTYRVITKSTVFTRIIFIDNNSEFCAID